MEFKDFLDELKVLKDERKNMCEQIKNHNLPIILFGAGIGAKQVTQGLNAYGLNVDGYAVDDKFYSEGQFYLDRPVYRFSDILKKSDKYILIPAVDNFQKDRFRFLDDKKIIAYTPSLLDYEAKINFDYILNNLKNFSQTFNFFEDDLSRKTMINHLKLKITGNFLWNREVFCPEEYFNDFTDSAFLNDRGGYLDCGAYRGDTIEQFINWRNGKYQKIFAFEIDPVNFSEMEKFVAEKNYKDVELLNCGVWDENTQLSFDNRGTDGSVITENGNATVLVKKIDDIVGEEPVNLIKMDIEGSELRALKGAKKTIEKNKPALAICAYHKTEDLITLPQYIKSLNKNYKLYLRRHSFITEWNIVLYAVP